MVGRRRLRSWVLAFAWGTTVVARSALAGDGVHLEIVAVTPDARQLAVAQNGEATWVCGLAKKPLAFPLKRAELEVSAACGGSGPLLPFERWTWSRSTLEIRALQPLTPAVGNPNTPARLRLDPDTQVRHLDVLLKGTWYPVLVDETSTMDEATAAERYAGFTARGRFSEILGFVRGKESVVITYSKTDGYALMVADDAIGLSDTETIDLAGRFSRAREKARARTKATREQYAARSGPFAERKPGEKSRTRAQVNVAREALKLWEQARIFGPLGSAELGDALWLLSWLDAPTRRQEAMRFYLELRDRDPVAAEATLRDFAADASTLPLATQLQTRSDPLRGLPAVNGCSVEPSNDANLTTVSDEALLWIHRAQWAARGYRFSDQKTQAYFEGFVWYAPTPKAAWRVRATKKFLEDPDAPLLEKTRASVHSTICAENLKAVLNAERARGLPPPAL